MRYNNRLSRVLLLRRVVTCRGIQVGRLRHSLRPRLQAAMDNAQGPLSSSSSRTWQPAASLGYGPEPGLNSLVVWVEEIKSKKRTEVR